MASTSDGRTDPPLQRSHKKLSLKEIVNMLFQEFCYYEEKKGKQKLRTRKQEDIKIDRVYNLLSDIEEFSICLTSKSDVESIKTFLSKIFIPFLHYFLDFSTETLWRMIFILLNILSDDSILNEEERQDVYFRLAYAKTPLGPNVHFPIQEDFKKDIIKSIPDKATDGLLVLEKLSLNRKSEVYSKKKTYSFFRLLEEFRRLAYINITADDLNWLMYDLWPPRIKEIDEDLQGCELCIGSTALNSRIFEKAIESKLPTMTVKWTNGEEEKFNQDDIRKHANPRNRLKARQDYTWILIDILKDVYHRVVTANEMEGGNEKESIEITKLLTLLANHEKLKGISNEFYALDIAYLLQICYEQNKELAKFIYDSLCLKKENQELTEHIVTGRSVLQMSNWSLEEILSTQFIRQLHGEDQSCALRIMVELIPKTLKEGHLEVFYDKLTFVYQGFASSLDPEAWYEALPKTKQLAALSLQRKSSKWLDIVFDLLSQFDKNKGADVLADWCLGMILQIQEPLPYLLSTQFIEKLHKSSVKIVPEKLFKLFQMCVDEIDTVSDKNIKTLEALACYIYELIVQTDIICDLKKDCGFLREFFRQLLQCLTYETSVEIKNIIIKSAVTILNNGDESFGSSCISNVGDLNNFVYHLLIGSYDKKDVEPLLRILRKPAFKQELRIMLDLVIKMSSPSDESVTEIFQYSATMTVFKSLCELYLQFEDAMLKHFFKENIHLLLRAFQHKDQELKENCIQVVAAVMSLNESQQITLNDAYHIEGQASNQHDDEFTDVFRMFVNSKPNVFPTSTFNEEDCANEVARLSKQIFSRNPPATVKLSLESIPKELEEYLIKPTPLVETANMKKSLDLIMGVIENPLNLLLEGETGVGKTAIISEAARRLGVPLIRLNLSSSTSIMSLFGSAFPTKSGGKMQVEFKEGPFTLAFKLGAWLLLDEFNLAPDNVLSSIESALDMSLLILPTDSIESSDENAERKYLEIPMHENFRLFCTQNPNTGLFKGKREIHSSSLLSRFTPVIVNAPSKDEIKQILLQTLNINCDFSMDQEDMATKITDVHVEISSEMAKMDESECAYAKVTIRDAMELTKKTSRILQLNNGRYSEATMSIIGNAACSVYASRLRKVGNQQKIKNTIQKRFQIEADVEPCEMIQGTELKGFISSQNIKPSFYSPEEGDLINFSNCVYQSVLRQLVPKLLKRKEVLDIGYDLYKWTLNTMSSDQALNCKVDAIMKKYQNLVQCIDEKTLVKDIVKKLSLKYLNISVIESKVSGFQGTKALTEEMRKCWVEMIDAVYFKQPVLLTGENGCGKSTTVDALARLCGKKVLHLYVTPETEPEALVGQNEPSKDDVVAWSDGIVTKAFKEGYWLIIENLSEAQSTVLERLNSILEIPPQWLVTENLGLSGECSEKERIEKHNQADEFRIFATMTPPRSKLSEHLSGANITTNSELSPALYNRFNIIHMENTLDSIPSLIHLYNVTVDAVFRKYAETFTQLFLKVRSLSDKKPVTLHHFERILKTANQLFRLNINPDPIFELFTGLELHLLGMFEKDQWIEVQKVIHDFFLQYSCDFATNYAKYLKLDPDGDNDSSYVISKAASPSRYDIACKISIAVLCDYSCLLEGPASSGKSSLVKYIAQLNDLKMEYINNTESTTMNDYVGTYMPGGIYSKGPLIEAMEKGHYFLADEFDLAEPAVLNMLYPLLEGKKEITIPNTSRVISAHPNFRFIAAQNGATYPGRKELPKSLRSRFSEVFFQEFSETEIKAIISKKASSLFSENPKLFVDSNAEKFAKVFRKINSQAGKSFHFTRQVNLTLRDLLKWLNRKKTFPDANLSLLGFELLYCRIKDTGARTVLAKIFKETFDDFPFDGDLDDVQPKLFVENGMLENTNNPHVSYKMSNVLHMSDELKEEIKRSTRSFQEDLWNVCVAMECNETILLIGPTSYKSHLISTWAKMVDRSDFEFILCNSSTDSADILGRLRPYSEMECFKLAINNSKQLLKCCSDLVANYSSHDNASFYDQRLEFADDKLSHLESAVLQMEFEHCNKNNENKSEKSPEKKGKTKTALIESFEAEHYDNEDEFVPDYVRNVFDSSDEEDIDADYRRHEFNKSQAEDSRPGIGFSTSSSESSESESESESKECEMKPIGFNDSDNAKEENDRSVIGGVDSSDEEIEDEIVEMMKSKLAYEDCHHSTVISDATKEGYKTCLSLMEELKEKMSSMIKGLTKLAPKNKMQTLVFLYRGLNTILSEIERFVINPESEVQTFLYQDGPCTKAVKKGSVLMMRDLDLPSQAVIERLNNLLEPLEPEFHLNEDFTLSGEEPFIAECCSSELTIPQSLKIIGTVHTKEKASKKPNLSPALRSRMTVIKTNAYTDSELLGMLNFSYVQNMDEIHQKIKQIMRRIQPFFDITSKDVFRLKNFVDRLFGISKTHFIEILAIGIIYLWVDRIPFNYDSKDIPHPYKFVLKVFDLETESMISIVKGKNLESEKRDIGRGSNYLMDMETIDNIQVAKIIGTPLICPTSPNFQMVIDASIGLYLSKSAFRNVCRIFAASASGLKLLLDGPPGVGKTKIIKQLSKALGFECIRINFSANTTYEDLMGSFLPIVEDDGSKRTIKFREGALVKAIKESDNTWILLDELNLANPTLLQKLMPLFTGANEFRNESANKVIPLKNLHIFATKNPETIGGGRKRLPDAVDACFTTIFLTQFDETELRDIGNFKMKAAKENGIISNDNAEKILTFHNNMCKAKSANFYSKQEPFNLRDLEKFILLMEKTSEFHRLGKSEGDETFESKEVQEESIRTNLNLIYGKRFDKENDQGLVQDEIEKMFPPSAHANNKFSVDTELKEFARIGHLYIKKGDCNLPLSFSTSQSICKNLVDIAAAIHTGLAILVQGGNSSGKTSLVRHISQICQRKLVIFQSTKDTTTSDLIGSWTVSNDKRLLEKIYCLMRKCSNDLLMVCITEARFNNLLNDLAKFFCQFNQMLSRDHTEDVDKLAIKRCLSVFNDLTEKLKDRIFQEQDKLWQIFDDIEKLNRLVKSFSQSDVHFVFVEGPLLEAIMNGYWFLFDNIGQAPGDVLERLNSLLEGEPELIVCEGPKMETFSRKNGRIHDNFRFIATNNTERKGHPLSTAILNRCLIINLKRLDTSTKVSIETIPVFDILCDLFQHLENRQALVSIILRFHKAMIGMQKQKEISTINSYTFNVRNVIATSKITLNQNNLQKGNLLEALKTAIEICYCSTIQGEDQTEAVWKVYVDILQKQSFQKEGIITTVATSSCSLEEVCTRYGKMVLAVLEAIGYFFESINLSSKSEVLMLFNEVFNCAKPLLESLGIQNLYLVQDEDISTIVRMLKDSIKMCLRVDSFGSLNEIMSKITSEEKKFTSTVHAYVCSASFADGNARNRIISSIFIKNRLLKLFVTKVHQLLEMTCTDEVLVDKCVRIGSILQKLSFISTFKIQLSQISTNDYRAIMSDIVNHERNLMGSKSADKDSQMLKYYSARLEQIYTVPLGQQELSHLRQNLIRNAIHQLQLKVNFKVDSTTLNYLIKSEFYALKFHCMTKMPLIALEKPTKVFDTYKVFEMEFCLVVMHIIEKISERFERWKNYDFPEIESAHEAEPFIGLHLTDDKDALKSELICIENQEFIEAKRIGSFLEEKFRNSVAQNWKKQFNNRKKIDIRDAIHNKDEFDIAVDIICFFKCVLTKFARKGETQLVFKEDIATISSQDICSNKALILNISLETGTIMIINPLKSDNAVDICCFTSTEEGTHQQKMILKKYEKFCSSYYHPKKTKPRTIFVESSCRKSDEYLVIAFLLERYLENIMISSPVSVTPDLIMDLKGKVTELEVPESTSENSNLVNVMGNLSKFFNQCQNDNLNDAVETIKELETDGRKFNQRYQALLNTMTPVNTREKTQLLRFIKQNQFHFSSLKTISILQSKCFENKVIDCLAICQLHEQLQSIINDLYLHAIQGHITCEPFNYTCETVCLIEDCVQLLLQGFKIENGFATPSPDIEQYIERVESIINDFCKEFVHKVKHRDVKFAIEIVKRTETDPSERETSPNIPTIPHTKNGSRFIYISQNLIITQVQRLKDANLKAYRYGFNHFLQRVSSLLEEISFLTSQVEENHWHRLNNGATTLVKEIEDICNKVKSENTSNALDLPWLKKPPDLNVDKIFFSDTSLPMAEQKEETRRMQTMDDEEYLHFLLGDSYSAFVCLQTKSTPEVKTCFRKTCPDRNAVMKDLLGWMSSYLQSLDCKEDVNKFENVLESLRKCNTSKCASITILKCFDSLGKEAVSGMLRSLKKATDSPECLMYINKLEMNMQESKTGGEIETHLKRLCEVIFKDRLNSLNQLEFASVKSLTEFAFLQMSSSQTQLGQLWESLQNSHQALKYLDQHLFLCKESQQLPMVQMDYLCIDDFLQFFTADPIISLSFSKKVEVANKNWCEEKDFVQAVKERFESEDLYIMEEESARSVARDCFRTICRVSKSCQENLNSIPGIIFCNIAYLHLLTDFWSDIEKNVEYLEDLQTKDFKTLQKFFCCKESQRFAKQVENSKNGLHLKIQDSISTEEKIKESQENLKYDKIDELKKKVAKLQSEIEGQKVKIDQSEKLYEAFIDRRLKSFRPVITSLGKELCAKYNGILESILQSIGGDVHYLDPAFYVELQRTSNSTIISQEYLLKLKEMKSQIVNVVARGDENGNWSKMVDILGHSKLYKTLKEMDDFGSCTTKSLVRALDTFTDVISESEEEKKCKRRVIEIGEKIKDVVKNTLQGESSNSRQLVLSAPSELADSLGLMFFDLIQQKEQFPADGRQITRSYIKKMLHVLCHLIKYLHDELAEHYKPNLLKETKIDETDIGATEKKKARETLETELITINFCEDGISFSTLKDNFSLVNDVLELEKSSCFVNLVNLSIFLDQLKIFLQEFLNKLVKLTISKTKCQNLVKLIWCFVEIFTIVVKSDGREDSMQNGHGSNFIRYSTTSLSSQEQERFVLFKLRQAIKPFTQMFHESKEFCNVLSKNVDFFEDLAVNLTMKTRLYEVEKMLSPKMDVIHGSDRKTSLCLDVTAKFIAGGMKQILFKSNVAFNNPLLFENSEERYKEIVLPTLSLMEDLRRKLTEMLLEDINIESSLLMDTHFFKVIQEGSIVRMSSLVDQIFPMKQINTCHQTILNTIILWENHWKELNDLRENSSFTASFKGLLDRND